MFFYLPTWRALEFRFAARARLRHIEVGGD